MKAGAKITVPNSNFVKILKDYEDKPYYSFFYNKSKIRKDKNGNNIKDKEGKDTYDVERYVINVMNVEATPEKEIQITEILDARPVTMTSKDGRTFLNCVLFVNAKKVEESNNSNNNYSGRARGGYSNPYQSNTDITDGLPF